VRFGLAIRARRRARGWRQSDLASAAGVSSSTICRIERAELASISYGTLETVTRALGVRLELLARWHGEGLDRLLDDDHARVVAASADPYREGGWLTDVEVTFVVGREIGSIDRFAFHPELRLLAVNECKSVVPDAGNTVLTLDRKARLAPLIGRQRGWPGAVGVARFLILPEGRTNRRRIEQHEGLFQSAFPVIGRDALAWIRRPTPQPISGPVSDPGTPVGARSPRPEVVEFPHRASKSKALCTARQRLSVRPLLRARWHRQTCRE
jgi:transcriptional regulator with XRE-family HTH domain